MKSMQLLTKHLWTKCIMYDSTDWTRITTRMPYTQIVPNRPPVCSLHFHCRHIWVWNQTLLRQFLSPLSLLSPANLITVEPCSVETSQQRYILQEKLIIESKGISDFSLWYNDLHFASFEIWFPNFPLIGNMLKLPPTIFSNVCFS